MLTGGLGPAIPHLRIRRTNQPLTRNDTVIASMQRRLDNRLIRNQQFENFMSMPGPEFVAPMVVYLATDEAKDINGQLFHAERSLIHTHYYGRRHAQSTNTKTRGCPRSTITRAKLLILPVMHQVSALRQY